MRVSVCTLQGVHQDVCVCPYVPCMQGVHQDVCVCPYVTCRVYIKMYACVRMYLAGCTSRCMRVSVCTLQGVNQDVCVCSYVCAWQHDCLFDRKAYKVNGGKVQVLAIKT